MQPVTRIGAVIVAPPLGCGRSARLAGGGRRLVGSGARGTAGGRSGSNGFGEKYLIVTYPGSVVAVAVAEHALSPAAVCVAVVSELYTLRVHTSAILNGRFLVLLE